jgi:PBP1b-binding outer membrane lipoprotein LpoB
VKRSLALTLAALALLLSGCAAQPTSSERPYTEAEIKQFALEMLSRSSLSYEDYQKIRRALLNPTQRMSNSIEDVDSLERQDAKRG